MKPKQFLLLIASVIAGILWIFIGQNFVLLNVLAEFLSGDGIDLSEYLNSASGPSFRTLWFTCITVALIWLVTTAKKSPMNSVEVREMRRPWWFCAIALVGVGWLYQLIWTVLLPQVSGTSPVDGVNAYYSIPPAGWVTLLVLVILDVGLLFWLPTMLASPKSYRLVVPGALKFFGGC